ncbi:DNA polymerase zeta [Monascus purpureus]|uniref:DNA polymerase n=1 Tax=Monascus purpureus TaxID=5098 RepID=A0A507QWK6_MONPU|nr:DNA polymerase zeta [Monascus purpureus]BDD63382.1 hypothetical protein MAP00_008279 [Monascus purpureus]
MVPFLVRLNCVDHYQATPSEIDPPLPYGVGASKDYDNDRLMVPIIRVFGSTETGQKVCAHVHGAFPYLYIEYDGALDPETVRVAIRSFHLSIDHALAASYHLGANDRKAKFVAHITLIKGIPFYGYYVGYRFFLKTYLLDPSYVTRLADLLLQGSVMERPFQPYESHLQYIPQWMCDYNLYGCAYMKCSKVMFRSPVPESQGLVNTSHRWHDQSIHPDIICDEFAFPRQSHCSLEVDVCVQDILNRLDVKERPLHHDFTEFLDPPTSGERLVPSMAGLWQDETRRRRKRLGIVDPQSNPFDPEDLISMSVGTRDHSNGKWAHEEEYRQMVSQIASRERLQNSSGGVMSFKDFVKSKSFEEQIKTASNSVGDFFNQKQGKSDFELHQVQDGCKQGETNTLANEQVAVSFGYSETNSYSDDDCFSCLSSHSADKEEKINYLIDDQLGIHAVKTSLNSNKKNTSSFAKRSLYEVPDYAPAKKKLRLGKEHGRLESDKITLQEERIRSSTHHDVLDGASRKSPSDRASLLLQNTAHSRISRQNQRLNFPVVKDPYDPMTVRRFTQEQAHNLSIVLDASQTLIKSPLIKSDMPTSNDERDGENISELQPLSASLESTISDPYIHEIAAKVCDAFTIPSNRRVYCFRRSCPVPSEAPSAIYSKAHYSDENDVPERPREYAGREFQLQGSTIHYLPDFDPSGRSFTTLDDQLSMPNNRDIQAKLDRQLRESLHRRVWEFVPVPPSRSEVIEWFENVQRKPETIKQAEIMNPKDRHADQGTKPSVLSQIEALTQNSGHDTHSQNKVSTSVEHEVHYMSTMSLEIHVNTRGVLVPNPEEDEVTCVFWCFHSENENIATNGKIPKSRVGMIFHDRPEVKASNTLKIDLAYEPTELDLFTRLVEIVRFYDPDILTGYEVHSSSWGYLIERAKKQYDYDMCNELSRVKSKAQGRFGKDSDRWGFTHSSSIRIVGRHMINIWRAMRSELNLLQYTMENVVFHVLRRRIPHYSFQGLTSWYQSGNIRNRFKVIDYFLSRVQMDIKILDSNELISRTSEQARLLGIDFLSVFSRGSQFKVESLMFRIAKPENFILPSPSRKQVGQQNALECLPLVMEPQSGFYTSPLLVLDFQSLYPSVMIAYNYCYSTFLGRVSSWKGRDKMGFSDYKRQPLMLELLRDKINIAPNGMMYTKPAVRRSLLARMLSEILETRVMLKTGMKADKDDKILQRLLNHRQLALKLIANVTYGYTSATFSGRMPCSEIADSIVQSGREILEKAIDFIHSNDRWSAEVVYGDTDSLFVYLKGRTREEAFDIGEEIAEAITQMNPRPVKLKFEKVYHPCVLLAKKRYVGFKYEHRNQKEPEFDAKGIETVRRDGTPAEQKIEENMLKILFKTTDLSQVKCYFQNQCAKIMRGNVPIQDFCFAREVRLGAYSERGPLPPGAMISTKKMLEDPRSEPQYGERVPYVVITGPPGSRLVDRCVDPETLIHNAQIELDSEYYITKNIIPPVERIFNLVGANVRQWYDEMPKFYSARRVEGTTTIATTTTISEEEGGGGGGGRTTAKKYLKKTLESYMKSSSCIVCKVQRLEDIDIPICNDCMAQPHTSLLNLVARQQREERLVKDLHDVCRSCAGVPFSDDVKCDSKDCPIFYSRSRHISRWEYTKTSLDPVIEFLRYRSNRHLLDW